MCVADSEKELSFRFRVYQTKGKLYKKAQTNSILNTGETATIQYTQITAMVQFKGKGKSKQQQQNQHEC